MWSGSRWPSAAEFGVRTSFNTERADQIVARRLKSTIEGCTHLGLGAGAQSPEGQPPSRPPGRLGRVFGAGGPSQSRGLFSSANLSSALLPCSPSLAVMFTR